MPNLIESQSPKVNTEHPILKRMEGIAKRTEVYFKEPSLQTRQQLRQFGQDSSEQDPLGIRAVIFEANEKPGEGKEKIAIFYQPGAEGTSAGAATIAAELMLQNTNLADASVSLTAGLSQFASVDRVNGLGDYPTDARKRATDLAAFVSEVVKNAKYTPEQVYLIGTSMAGIDVVSAAPLLDQLFKANGLETKIGGIILNQSGGMYDQPLVPFLTQSVPRHTSFVDEMDMLYPTFNNFADVETAIARAREKGDKPLEMQKSEQLKRMHHYKNNPPFLDLMTSDEKTRFGQIEATINDSVDKVHGTISDKQVKIDDLLKERTAFLKEIIGRAFASADKEPKTFPALAYANMFDPRQGPSIINKMPVLKPLPEEDRDNITVPTAVVMADEEAYFTHKEFTNSEKEMEIEGKGNMFKKATEYVVKVFGWSHNGTLVDQPRFGKMMGSLIERMRRDQKAGGSQQQVVHLTM